MSNLKAVTIGEFIDFNPSEKLQKNTTAKKIPMDKLGTFERKIKGFELSEYKSGPKFKNKDTLLAKITPCLENGKTALVDILEDNEIAFGSSEFIVLRNNELSDYKFIYYLARSPYFREKAISCMEGTSGRKRVNEGALKNLNINVPSLSIQQKIAKILSDLDDKIEVLNQLNDNLAQLAKTIYDYWFVQFDFPDESGKPYKSSGGKMVYNEILKREIPEGWEVKKLGKYALIKKGTLITEKQANTSGNIKVVSAGLDFSYYHDESNFSENTITISASGANAGIINFWREPIFACDCTIVRGNSLTETLYIYQSLKIL
ncbi:restriction endonuclease subunit S [Riemerella anatipestifer]|uniref:Restriction endonuclease subunit S n=4 Tax=Riemerella anatipestifer TaxID=34085 RepID=A0A1S7DPW1_RIEAN|nr:restriction endonuclease subunit S [Riemerella anatipestifer]AQY21173.1 restriction endonuclease subunit S [Riemerella anatipestifer]